MVVTAMVSFLRRRRGDFLTVLEHGLGIAVLRYTRVGTKRKFRETIPTPG
jgi:hypothetical protein